MTEQKIRQRMCSLGRSLFERGLTGGASGNLSARLEHGLLATPTGVSLGALEPDGLSLLDNEGNHVSGPRPTKETFLHLAFYRARPRAGAVVHTHSTHAVAVSCLAGADPADVLPPITPYFVMRVGSLPLVPYFRPGDPAMAEAVARLAPDHAAVLLANHGPVVSGKDLDAAAYALEELEETAKLFLLLRLHKVRTLTDEQVADLGKHFPAP